MGIGHIFDTVGNNFPGGEGIKHTVMSHCDPVVYGDGIEFRCETTSFFDQLLHVLTDLV